MENGTIVTITSTGITGTVKSTTPAGLELRTFVSGHAQTVVIPETQVVKKTKFECVHPANCSCRQTFDFACNCQEH